MRNFAILSCILGILLLTGCQTTETQPLKTQSTKPAAPQRVGIIALLDKVTVRTAGIGVAWEKPAGLDFPELSNKIIDGIDHELARKGYKTTMLQMTDDQSKRLYDNLRPNVELRKMLQNGELMFADVDAVLIICPRREGEPLIRLNYLNTSGGWATFFQFKSKPNRINVTFNFGVGFIDARTFEVLSYNSMMEFLDPTKIEMSGPVSIMSLNNEQKAELLEKLQTLISKVIPAALEKIEAK